MQRVTHESEAEPSAGVVLPDDVKGKERTIYKSGLKYHGDTTKCHDKIHSSQKKGGAYGRRLVLGVSLMTRHAEPS